MDLGSLSLEYVIDDDNNRLVSAKYVCAICNKVLVPNLKKAITHVADCLEKTVITLD